MAPSRRGTARSRRGRTTTRRGTAGGWTYDDVEAARQEANTLAHPFGENGPTLQDRWQQREPITEGQRQAVLRLNRAERELGADGSAIVHDVLVKGMTMEQIGKRRGLETQRWKDYFSRRFQECLDRLAQIYGFATEKPGPTVMARGASYRSRPS